jgi:hypothetical protein
VHRRSAIPKSTIGCGPTMFQNTLHQLSSEQVLFLNRGPCYVSPCQMHYRIHQEQQQQQMASLRQRLTQVFTKFPVDLSRRMKFENEIKQLSNDCFTLPTIPTKLQERALYEKQLIKSIRNDIRRQGLILRRTADDNNTYYLGQRSLFNFKVNQYIQTANCFELIGKIDTEHTEQDHLKQILLSMDKTLNDLLKRKLITQEHLTKFSMSKRTTIKLPHLDFLPELNPDNNGMLVVQPRISSSSNSPIQILATYLEQLLRPLFENVSQSTTFTNGGDFLKKLQSHCFQSDLLRPTTSLITFEIHHLYTHLSYTKLRNALPHLLMNPLVYKASHQGLHAEGIEELTNLFLQNNIFIYNGKIYRYIKGCPLNFPLSRLLFNIYLHYWQITLRRSVRVANEFFGLYYSTGFFTWNRSVEEIQKILNELNQSSFDAPIHLTFSINSHAHFINCYIENQQGHLYTNVYYDRNEQQQPFLLPYFSQHPRLLHRQWFRFLLVRAGLYCSQLQDFFDEQLNIELTYLANGYSLDFIEYHLRQFFRLMSPVSNGGSICVQELTQYRYNALRKDLFRYHSVQIRKMKEQQQELEPNHKLIQFNYLYDWGLRCQFNVEFSKKWIEILEKDPKFKKYGLTIQLQSIHCYSSNILLHQ